MFSTAFNKIAAAATITKCSQDYTDMITDLSTNYQIDIIKFLEKINNKVLTSTIPLNWLILKNIINKYNDILSKFTLTPDGQNKTSCKDPLIGFLKLLGLSENSDFFKIGEDETYFIRITPNAQNFTLSWDNFGMNRPYISFINMLRDSIIAINSILTSNSNINDIQITSIPTGTGPDMNAIKTVIVKKEIPVQIQKISQQLPNYKIDEDLDGNVTSFYKFISNPNNYSESLLTFLFQIENISVILSRKNISNINDISRKNNVSEANTELGKKYETFKTNFENEKKSIITAPKGGSKLPQIVDKYVYKNKKYKIRFGPKGGKYILVDGETIRI